MNKNNSERRFRNICLLIMILFAFVCILPFLLMLSSSFTDEDTLIKEGYKFWPSVFSFDSYKYLWAKRDTIFRAYGMSIFITAIGTLINVTITSLFAYPLFRKDFKYRNIFAFFVFFAMLFNGGMTAAYIIWSNVFHIKNTLWALLVPNNLMGAMNILLVRNYYTASIPQALLDAAKVDGATDMKIYTKIMVPLSRPVITTIALFAGMVYWNDWINGLYYISDTKLYTINVYLNKLMDNIALLKVASTMNEGAQLMSVNLPSVGIRMAIAVVAILPVIIIFPLVQSQLIKGVVVGGVKG